MIYLTKETARLQMWAKLALSQSDGKAIYLSIDGRGVVEAYDKEPYALTFTTPFRWANPDAHKWEIDTTHTPPIPLKELYKINDLI